MTHAPEPAPEVKSGDAELAQAFDEFMRSFEGYRDGNDHRLGELERRCRPTS